MRGGASRGAWRRRRVVERRGGGAPREAVTCPPTRLASQRAAPLARALALQLGILMAPDTPRSRCIRRLTSRCPHRHSRPHSHRHPQSGALPPTQQADRCAPDWTLWLPMPQATTNGCTPVVVTCYSACHTYIRRQGVERRWYTLTRRWQGALRLLTERT